MDRFWKCIQLVITTIGGWIGYFIGEKNSLFYMLIAFVVVDYLTGVMKAIVEKKLSSEVGFKGICKKVLIFVLIGIANLIDIEILKSGAVLRTATIFFYLSNEGISILENASSMGLPVPKKIKEILEQLKESEEN